VTALASAGTARPPFLHELAVVWVDAFVGTGGGAVELPTGEPVEAEQAGGPCDAVVDEVPISQFPIWATCSASASRLRLSRSSSSTSLRVLMYELRSRRASYPRT
jgi:hypothetical protein